MSDIIPVKDAEFDAFINRLLLYCAEKVRPGPNGEPAAWPHISQEEMNELISACTEWGPAYNAVKSPHGPVETARKNAARKKVEAVARPFIQRNIYNAEKWVTIDDIIALGLKPHDRKPTHHGAPTDYVEGIVKNAPTGPVHFLEYHIVGKSNKGKHPHHCAEIQMALRKKDEALPAADSDEGWSVSEICMDSPFKKSWRDEESGHIACYRLRWEDANGLKGPWSMVTGRIP